MPFIGLVKVQVFIKGRGGGTLNNNLMRSKSEEGVGGVGDRGGWVVQISANVVVRQSLKLKVVSRKSRVIFELECHHHSWSHFLFFAGLHVYFHIHIQIFLT